MINIGELAMIGLIEQSDVKDQRFNRQPKIVFLQKINLNNSNIKKPGD